MICKESIKMGTWQDIQKGKKPWRPKLTRRSISIRLAFSLPFLAFGCAVLYYYSTCNVYLKRDANQKVNSIVSKSYWGVPFLWKHLGNISNVRVDSEMRTVEKVDPYGSSKGSLSLNEVSVSKVVLTGGKDKHEELAVSPFLYDADSINSEVAHDLSAFLKTKNADEIKRDIPPAGSATPPFLAMLFLFGLGGFVFISIPTDMIFWWIQYRYKKTQKAK